MLSFTRLTLVVISVVAIAGPAAAQTSMHTFTNTVPNAVPAMSTQGQAATYPSNIAVAGLTGSVYHVSVTVTVSHTFPVDLDLLLISPSGRGVMLLSDVGGGTAWNNTALTFDDCAPRSLTAGTVVRGRYRPTNGPPVEAMPAPAPGPPYGNTLSEFVGSSANGTWSLYAVDDAPLDTGSIASWSITLYMQPASPITLGTVPISCTMPDYDGDGRTDVAVYREATGQWFISQSGSNGALMQVEWGAPALGDIHVPADYDYDGITDIAVYRQSTGDWFIRKSTDLSLQQITFGAPASTGLGDTPVPGDYDGDGAADIAVYRTTTGQWFFRYSSGQPPATVQWGFPPSNDKPARR